MNLSKLAVAALLGFLTLPSTANAVQEILVGDKQTVNLPLIQNEQR